MYSKEHFLAYKKQFFQKKVMKTYIITFLIMLLGIYGLVKSFSGLRAFNEIKKISEARDYEMPEGLDTELYISVMMNVIFSIIGLYIIIYSIRLFFAMRKVTKNFKSESSCKFVFDDEGFTYSIAQDGWASEIYVDYPQIRSALENENFFFIIIDNQPVSVFAKNELTEGAPEELRMLLHNKLGEKFGVDYY